MESHASSKRSWGKRLAIIGLALFTLYLAFGIWGVPAILKSQIRSKGSEALGREVSVERASFNPFTLEAKLYGMTVGPGPDQSEALLEIDKLTANPQVSSVLGTVTLKSVDVSDGRIWVGIDDSGAFSFQDILDTLAAAPAPEAETAGEAPPITVESLLVSKLSIHFRDSSLQTPYQETLTIESISGQDIGTVAKDGIDEADTSEDRFHWEFDGQISTASGGRLELQGGALSLSPWRFRVESELSGFPLQSLQPYVDQNVAAQVAGTVGFDLTQTVEFGSTGPAAQVRGRMGIDAFSAVDAEQAFARWESFQVSGIDLDAVAMNLSVQEVSLQGPQFEAILLADGSPRLPEMKKGGAPEAAGPQGSAPDFRAAIDSVVVTRGHVTVEDRSLADPFRSEVDNLELNLSQLEARQVDGVYDASGVASIAMELLGGKVELDAALESLQGLATASLSVAGIQLGNLQPYVAQYANAELQDGSLDVSVEATLQGFSDPQASGWMELQGLALREMGTLKEIASLSSLRVSGVDFSGDALTIEAVKLVEPMVAAWQDESGISLAQIVKLEQDAERQAEALEREAGIRFKLERFELESAGFNFVDTTPIRTHDSSVSDFNLVVEGISTDPDALAAFDFSGVVDGNARIAGKGAVSIAEPGDHLDIDMSFRGYDLTSTSPYWATYLGRELSQGQFEIRSSYQVRDQQLTGMNDFKIDQLTLGEKVDSERAINLPLSFAINLMRDPSGAISYDGLPVEGDLSNPEVKPWGLVGKAVRNLILNAVASPLKFLASIAGGREDLDSIRFAVSEVELDATAMEKVEALRKVMASRPGLRLEVGFLTDPKQDAYLKEQYMLHRLANPEFDGVSGLDLLKPVDRSELEAAVVNRYAALQAEEEARMDTAEDPLPPTMEAAEEAPKEVAPEEDEERRGVLRRLANLLGLRRDEKPATETSPPQEMAEEAAEAPVADRQEVSEQQPEPPFEEKLAAVVEALPPVELDENWEQDLERARIQNFKAALTEGEAIDASRIFTVELAQATAKGELGALSIQLTD